MGEARPRPASNSDAIVALQSSLFVPLLVTPECSGCNFCVDVSEIVTLAMIGESEDKGSVCAEWFLHGSSQFHRLLGSV